MNLAAAAELRTCLGINDGLIRGLVDFHAASYLSSPPGRAGVRVRAARNRQMRSAKILVPDVHARRGAPLAAIASADDRVVTPVAGPAEPRCCTRRASGGARISCAGSQDDPPGKEGLAALAASMVAEGGSKLLHLQPDSGSLLPDGGAAQRILL